MNLKQLEYFISAAENLNFSRAASKCFISQTAMTQQIQAIERTVGVPLFLRDKHHVELTAAGKVYLNEARIILDRSNDAVRLAKLAAEGTQGELSIGFINGYGLSDLPKQLKRFHGAYPGIKINLMRSNMSVLLEHMEKGECDLVFTVTLHKSHDQKIGSRYIKSYPVMAVLPEGHPLGAKEYLTYEELKNEDFIMMQPGNRPRDQMEESLLIYERGGYLPNIAAIEGDQETLLLMISVGMGISILPEYIIRHVQAGQGLHVIPMVKKDMSAETVDLEVCWMKENGNPAVEQFIEMLQK